MTSFFKALRGTKSQHRKSTILVGETTRPIEPRYSEVLVGLEKTTTLAVGEKKAASMTAGELQRMFGPASVDTKAAPTLERV